MFNKYLNKLKNNKENTQVLSPTLKNQVKRNSKTQNIGKF